MLAAPIPKRILKKYNETATLRKFQQVPYRPNVNILRVKLLLFFRKFYTERNLMTSAEK